VPTGGERTPVTNPLRQHDPRAITASVAHSFAAQLAALDVPCKRIAAGAQNREASKQSQRRDCRRP
jgi:hypothetical protein